MPRSAAPLAGLTLAVLAAGCAASKGRSDGVDAGGEPTPLTTVRVAGDGGSAVSFATGGSAPAASVQPLAVSADAAWAALPAVYTALGIDFTTLDASRRTIGNGALRVRRKLGDVPVSRYLSCGNTNSNETYELTIAVQSVVAPAGNGASTVSSLVQGTARSALFTSADVACVTTRELEKRIGLALAQKAAGM
jgi:hypothetical protein